MYKMEDIMITKPAVHKNSKQRYSPEFEELLKNSISSDEFLMRVHKHIDELYDAREKKNCKIQ
jgi:hypothetical protein